MSHTSIKTVDNPATKKSIKDAPYYTVPVILAILMVSSGAFYVLLALGISIMSKAN